MTSFFLPFIGGAITILVGIWIYRLIVNRRSEDRFKDDLDV